MKRPITLLVVGVCAILLSATNLLAQPTFTVSPQSITAGVGQSFTVDVTVKDFNDILSFQYSMSWNQNAIEYTGLSNITPQLDGFSQANFGLNNTNNGKLTVSWFDPNVTGVDLPNNTVLYSLTFKVLTNSPATIAFGNDPTVIEVTNSAGENIGMIPQNASVNGGGGGGGGNPPVTGFAVIASDETVQPNANFCLDVSVQSFVDIVSMQYSMSFDATKLQFTGLQGFNLNGLSAANFGTNQANNGTLTMSWLDPEVNGESLPDGTVIYQVCFKAIGAEDCSTPTQFQFTNTPTPAEVTDINGEIPFQGVPGDILICSNGGGGGNPQGLAFIGSQETAAPGDTVCVDVSVQDFDCIVSAQFSMHYNKNILQFINVTGFGLPDLSAANFSSGTAGTITFSWFDQTTNGVSLPDSTVIFQLCFKAVGADGSSSDISFDGTPTVIEVTDCQSQELTPSFVKGKVTISSSGGCAGPVQITSNAVTHVKCKGGNSGAIDISVSGGNGNYSYNWSNGAKTQDISNLAAGTYTVTVTSCSGSQTSTASFTIDEPASAISATAQLTNPACFGQSTGAINLTVNGGTFNPPSCTGYTFNWSNGATTEDLINVPAGSYTVTITDCNGCQLVEGPFELQGPPSQLVVNLVAEPSKCFGQASGSITINATGGVAPYQYRIVNVPPYPNWSGNNTFGSLLPNNYTVQVRDAFGCILTNQTSITSPPALNVTLNATDATSGNCDGAIDATVTGGVTPYSYTWSNGATTQDLSAICSGQYSLTVTDANGCTKSASDIVSAPLLVSSTKKNACFETCDGSVTLNVSGGVPPLQYTWSNGATTKNVSGLCPGSYSVTVTSPIDNQTQTLTVNISQAQSPVVVNNTGVVNTPSNSQACDGSINVSGTASGGFGPPYSFSWSTGASGAILTGVCEGTYTVTAADVNGCTATTSYEVDYIPPPLSVTSVPEPACSNSNNGKLTVLASGGTPPFNITINGPSGTLTVTNDADGQHTFQNLLPGTYTISVKDGGLGPDFQQMNATGTVDVVVFSLGNVKIYPATASLKGKIEIKPSGGTIPYTFQWSNGSTAQNPTNLEAGCYDLTICDANGCCQVFENLCVGLLQANAIVTQPDCPDQMGSIAAVPNGGNWPYQYVWRNTATNEIVGTDSLLTNQPVGTYSLLLTDALGVSVIQTFEIKPQSNLSALATVTTNFNGYGVRCFGGNSGAATVTPQNGVPPYSILWLDNNSTNPSRTNLTAGNYQVRVTDAQGCSVTKTVVVTQPPALVVVAEGDRSGCNETSGLATAFASGGVPPYTYSWNDPQAQKSQTAVLLSTGTYQVMVNDANGCAELATAVVPEFEPLVLKAASEPDEGGPNGKAIVIVESGTWPYTFSWKDYPSTDSVLTELLPGNYLAKVRDANDCEEVILIKVGDATLCGEVRTVISPNGDGLNEEFIIACLSRYYDNKLEIYNRWGQLVYQTNNYNDGNLWRGTTNSGKPVPDGVYMYVFEYLDPVTNKREVRKGTVSVIRQ